MKYIIKSFIAAAIVMITVSGTQAQKTGHINLQDLIKDMPEMRKVQDSLIAIEKQWKDYLEGAEGELQRKYAEIQGPVGKAWTPMQRQLKEKDFEEARAKFETASQKAQEDLQEKQTTFQEPVYEKAKKVINEVAKDLGYTTVINSTGGYVLLVSNPADDLMAAVKKKMGIADKPTTVGSPITPRK